MRRRFFHCTSSLSKSSHASHNAVLHCVPRSSQKMRYLRSLTGFTWIFTSCLYSPKEQWEFWNGMGWILITNGSGFGFSGRFGCTRMLSCNQNCETLSQWHFLVRWKRPDRRVMNAGSGPALSGFFDYNPSTWSFISLGDFHSGLNNATNKIFFVAGS